MMIMDSSKPLYLQVKADIKNRILSKQYMPGDKLPTENELSDQYNVSKITIRKAIQNLSDEGYVNKVQGKGTFINFKKDKLYLNKTSGFKESLSSLGHASRHDIIQASFLNADEDIAEKLMIPMGTKVVYIEAVWSGRITNRSRSIRSTSRMPASRTSSRHFRKIARSTR